jgi:hypothetical protein
VALVQVTMLLRTAGVGRCERHIHCRGPGTLRRAGHAVGEAQLVKVGEAGAGPDTLASPQSTMVNRN